MNKLEKKLNKPITEKNIKSFDKWVRNEQSTQTYKEHAKQMIILLWLTILLTGIYYLIIK